MKKYLYIILAVLAVGCRKQPVTPEEEKPEPQDPPQEVVVFESAKEAWKYPGQQQWRFGKHVDRGMVRP